MHEWTVPYLPIDPTDIGRTYDAEVIRVNSQSGKGGIAFVLEKSYGFVLPSGLREHFSSLCKHISDQGHRELRAGELYQIFSGAYQPIKTDITMRDFDITRTGDLVRVHITFSRDGADTRMEAEGNGSLNAVNNALKAYTGEDYVLQVFSQHSMQGEGSRSVAASYIGLEAPDGELYWGVGTDTDVVRSSARALLNAFQNMMQSRHRPRTA